MLTCFNITQQGQSHTDRGIPCQDFSTVHRMIHPGTGREILIAAIADGVGACLYSHLGARTAVESAVLCLRGILEEAECAFFETDEAFTDALRCSFGCALDSVAELAALLKLPEGEFDSTLTVAVYDGEDLRYGHIGDDGIVVLYCDGTYEMITRRHKGEEVMFVMPLTEKEFWEFGRTRRKTAAFAMMTDGVLDHCVDGEAMHSRVYFPFLKPALAVPMFTEEDTATAKADWEEYLAGSGQYPVNFRREVTDDITFAVIQNPDAVSCLPDIKFDYEQWQEESRRRAEELNEILYADFREYQNRRQRKKESAEETVLVPEIPVPSSFFRKKHFAGGRSRRRHGFPGVRKKRGHCASYRK